MGLSYLRSDSVLHCKVDDNAFGEGKTYQGYDSISFQKRFVLFEDVQYGYVDQFYLCLDYLLSDHLPTDLGAAGVYGFLGWACCLDYDVCYCYLLRVSHVS